MSYCVNCGVKVIESEESCPLCNCPVVNPMKDKTMPEDMERPYPKRRDTLKNIIDRKFIISVISILYLLPIIICIAVDVTLQKSMTWSVISTASVILCWAIIFLPYILEKRFASVYLTMDLALMAVLFSAIAWYINDYDWVSILAMPIALAVYVILTLIIYGINMKVVYGLYIGAIVMSGIGVISVITELLVWNYLRHYVAEDSAFAYWSLFVFISCIIVAGLLCYTEWKKAVKRGLEKRFHI